MQQQYNDSKRTWQQQQEHLTAENAALQEEMTRIQAQHQTKLDELIADSRLKQQHNDQQQLEEWTSERDELKGKIQRLQHDLDTRIADLNIQQQQESKLLRDIDSWTQKYQQQESVLAQLHEQLDEKAKQLQHLNELYDHERLQSQVSIATQI